VSKREEKMERSMGESKSLDEEIEEDRSTRIDGSWTTQQVEKDVNEMLWSTA
jgi:hypothetical protein